MWSAGCGAVYDSIVAHPFLRGLTAGDLPGDRFAYYIAQDVHYLRHYARALAVVASKAPTHAEVGVLARHAAATVDVELALHESLLPRLGLAGADVAAIPVSPTTLAYTSHLLATAHGGSFAEGLAAVLPCYWIYARVGVSLAEHGSPDPRYAAWIDTYGGDVFAAVVAEVLALADRVGATLSEDEAARAGGHFIVSCRYEWMFFDAAWRQEAWPIT